MALPQQTFQTIQQLISYINSLIIPNGSNAITGAEANNVFNGLTTFIQTYTLNNSLVTIYNTSGGGAYALSSPMTYFSQAPASIQWAGNMQNEYYITNGTSVAIPITSGYSFTDQYGVVQTTIPANTSIHIAKATNQSWIQQNNLPGGSGGGGLPPIVGHNGQALFNNGEAEFWSDSIFAILAGDPNWTNGVTWVNGTTYSAPNFSSPKFFVFWNDASRFLLPAEYEYISGGFTILVGGFNSASANIFLIFKGANS